MVLNELILDFQSGFSSIYLNERLIYGLAPDDLDSVFKQRLRWAMGSLQVTENRTSKHFLYCAKIPLELPLFLK